MKDIIEFLEQKAAEGFTIQFESINVEHKEKENPFSAWIEYEQKEIEVKIILKKTL